MSLLTTLLLLQVALPVALLLWLLVRPARNRVSWIAQVAASALVLLALAAAGVWTVPPWWTAWVYGSLWVLGLAIGVRRWSRMDPIPRRASSWASTAMMTVLSLYAGSEAACAWAGRTAPDGPLYTLQFPLADGNYLILNGGDDIRINAHLATRDFAEPRLQRWRGNGYGIDIVAIDSWGLRAGGMQPSDNNAYRIFGRAVYAPCSGSVIVAVDGLPDMPPPRHDVPANAAGNHVILACDGAHVVLAHFRRGTVRIRVGDAVRTGDPLAEVGNSGGTDEPHLHIHVQRPGTASEPMGGDPVPASFNGRFPLRGDRVTRAR